MSGVAAEPAAWTDEMQWQRVNQVMELVKQEGDMNCEAAFDFLLALLLRNHRVIAEVIDRLSTSRHTFKSRQVAEARALLETLLPRRG